MSGPEPKKEEPIFTEKSAVIQLLAGKTVKVRGIGNSMTPILKSGDVCTVRPIKKDDVLKKGDIVLCKVKGNVYMHIIKGLNPKKGLYLIGNNHGRINGWTSLVYGIVE